MTNRPTEEVFLKKFNVEYSKDSHWIEQLCKFENLQKYYRKTKHGNFHTMDVIWRAMNIPEMACEGIESAEFDPEIPAPQVDFSSLIIE